MSIGSIGSYSNWWQWQNQAASSSGSSASSSASSSSPAITNSGSPAATTNVSAFLQAFSADLQTMLTEMNSTASTSTAAASPTVTNTGTTSADQAATDPSSVHHHHRHHHGGEAGAMQQTADQLVGEIGQSTQGTLTTNQINQSASLLATDLMQAMQSYGSIEPNSFGPSILA